MSLRKSVLVWSYSGPFFPAFRLNAKRYSVSLNIESEYGKIRTRITPNTGTFYVVHFSSHLFLLKLTSLKKFDDFYRCHCYHVDFKNVNCFDEPTS